MVLTPAGTITCRADSTHAPPGAFLGGVVGATQFTPVESDRVVRAASVGGVRSRGGTLCDDAVFAVLHDALAEVAAGQRLCHNEQSTSRLSELTTL